VAIWDTIAGTPRPPGWTHGGAAAGRVGTPADVAQAALALTVNPFITGTVVHVDGGQGFV